MRFDILTLFPNMFTAPFQESILGKAIEKGLIQIQLVNIRDFAADKHDGAEERVREIFADKEISIGDYVLTGGEFAAMVILDAVSRLLPGVLGSDRSAAQGSLLASLLEDP